MNFQVLMKLFVPILMIVIGLMSKYSSQDGWGTKRRLWLFLIISGLFSLVYNIYKYLM